MLLVLALIGVGVYCVPRSRGRRFLATFVVALFLLSWPPCDYLFSRPLEGPYLSKPFTSPAGLDAIVVLASAISPARADRPYPLPDHETFERCQYASWIYSKTPLPILVSGGGGNAMAMRGLLLASGVPANMIWIEDRSRNTHENAARSAAILKQHGAHRIALVVDARSMLRASACFRREGVDVVAAPSKFRDVSAHI